MSEERDPNFFSDHNFYDSVNRYEDMLKQQREFFFDVHEFEEIIDYYIDNRYFTKAFNAIETAISQHPGTNLLKLKKANLFIEQGKPQEALIVLNQQGKVEPENSDIYILKGLAYLLLRRVRDAIRSYNQALDMTTEDKVDILLAINDSISNAQETDLQIRYLTQAHQIEPENLEVIWNLSGCFEQKGDFSKSVSFLDRYLDIDPFSDHIWYNMGSLYEQLNESEKAIEAYDYTIALNEYYLSAYFGKANAMSAIDKYTEAIKVYCQILEFDDENEDVFCCIGECYEKMEDYKNAYIYYKKATEIEEHFPEAWHGLGLVMAYRKQYTKALKYINKAIALDDENSEFWFALGNIYNRLKKPEKAMPAFRKTVSLDEHDFEAWLNLADLYAKKNEIGNAIDTLTESYEFNEKNAFINYRLAAYFFMLGIEEFGLDYLEKGLKLNYVYHKAFLDAFPEAGNIPVVLNLLKKHKK